MANQTVFVSGVDTSSELPLVIKPWLLLLVTLHLCDGPLIATALIDFAC